MNNFNAWCFVFLIVFVEAKSVSSLECYECAVCNDPFDSSKAKEVSCTGSCVKAKTKNGDVARTCSPLDLGDTCEEDAFGGEACSCKSDLCNSASGKNISIIGLCLSVFIMFLWMK